jgi:hypothetical protein
LPGRYRAPDGEPLAQYRARDEGVNGGRSLRKVGVHPRNIRARAHTVHLAQATGSHPSSVELAERPRWRIGPHAKDAGTPRHKSTDARDMREPATRLRRRPGRGAVGVPEYTPLAIGDEIPTRGNPGSNGYPSSLARREAIRCACYEKAPFTKSVGLRTRAAAPRTIAQAAFPPPTENTPEKLREQRLGGCACGRGRVPAARSSRARRALVVQGGRAHARGTFQVVGAARRRTRRRLRLPLHSVIRHDARRPSTRGGGDPALHHLRG